jgi:acyl transferase domain-containing protein
MRTAGGGVAVIGMSGRFPGAASVPRLWQNLLAGEESLARFSGAQLAEAGVPEEVYRHVDYVPVRGILADVDLFDAELFGIAPREAEIMDPQHRILLECAWEAVESAGYTGRDRRVGVFVGTSINTYLWRHLLAVPRLERELGLLPLVLGNEKDHAACRIAYRMGLLGPAVAVQTACSTSLAAVHLACQSLLRGECDMALAGGVTLQLPQNSGYLYDRNGIASPDGHCRAFDANAHGTVGGNGAGLVLLKPLSQALADDDLIHAVILGSAMNNDGGRKAGYSAPSMAGQAEAIRMALDAAGATADTIGYVETHGTGTELGDGIEIAALTEAFRADTDRTSYCGVGSVKPNVGHLDAAAGVTGLIKGVLAVREGVMPPSINCTEPNPAIPWKRGPFFVCTEVRPWPDEQLPRRCGVSSFGIGGTNVHVIVEQPPARRSRAPRPGGAELVLVSGRNEAAARAVSAKLADHVERPPDETPADLELADVAFTSRVGRTALPWRAHVVADRAPALPAALRAVTPRAAGRGAVAVFMFPGQGAQYAGMAREPYDQFPRFRQEVDACAEILRPLLGLDLRELLCGTPSDERTTQLTHTRLAQPALFTVSYALARQLVAWGVRPRTMIGHSVGEYVAACLAGAFSVADGLRLVAARGELMARVPGGGMLTVLAAPERVARYLRAGLEIAAVNAPGNTVVAGENDRIDQLRGRLLADGVTARRLRVSHAFHSAMMEPIMGEFWRVAERVHYRPLRTRVMSNTTGDVMPPNGGCSARYLTEHLRRPVLFSAALRRVLAGSPHAVLIEVGPGRTLAALALMHNEAQDTQVVSTMPGPTDRVSARWRLFDALGTAWSAGVPIDWAAVDDGRVAGRTTLPTYPFQRRRFWISAAPAVAATAGADDAVVTQDEGHSATEAGVPPAGTFHPDEVESTVRSLWEQLLGVTAPGPEDNFFALGGDSLLGVRLVAAMKTRLGVSVELSDLLEAVTVRQQTEKIVGVMSGGSDA